MQSEKFIPFSSSVGSFFSQFLSSIWFSGGLGIQESVSSLCWNPKKTAKLWKKICIPETLKEFAPHPFVAAKRRHLYFLSPLSFSRCRMENPILFVSAFLIYLMQTIFGMVGWREEPKHGIILFLVSENITSKIQLKGSKSLHQLPCGLLGRSCSHEGVPEPSVWLTRQQYSAQKETTQLRPWCWHVVMAFLNYGAVFCLPLAGV